MRLPSELVLRHALEDTADGRNLFPELGKNGGNGIRHIPFLLERLISRLRFETHLSGYKKLNVPNGAPMAAGASCRACSRRRRYRAHRDKQPEGRHRF